MSMPHTAHFWKARWEPFRRLDSTTTPMGKWLFICPTKSVHGIVGVDVVISPEERAHATFDLETFKKRHAYDTALKFLIDHP